MSDTKKEKGGGAADPYNLTFNPDIINDQEENSSRYDRKWQNKNNSSCYTRVLVVIPHLAFVHRPGYEPGSNTDDQRY